MKVFEQLLGAGVVSIESEFVGEEGVEGTRVRQEGTVVEEVAYAWEDACSRVSDTRMNK